MPKVNRKEKSFEIICPRCLGHRFVTYAQKWNIDVGNSSGKCPSCVTPLNGYKNRFKKGQKAWNKGLPSEAQPMFGKTRDGYFGENNPVWKGDDCSHEAHHQWLYRRLGKARKCEYCGFTGRCHWANIKNHQYHKDINDYISLCPKCHKRYDNGSIKL